MSSGRRLNKKDSLPVEDLVSVMSNPNRFSLYREALGLDIEEEEWALFKKPREEVAEWVRNSDPHERNDLSHEVFGVK